MEEDGLQGSYDWIHPPAGESEFELWDAEDIHAMGKCGNPEMLEYLLQAVITKRS